MGLPVPKLLKVSEALTDRAKYITLLKSASKDYMIDGENIIKAANHEGELVIEDAKNEANQLKDRADKVLDDAKKEYEKGFAAGRIDGKKEALAEGLTWLMDAKEIKSSIFQQVKAQTVITLEKVLSRAIKNVSTEWITKQLEEVVSSLEGKDNIVISVSETFFSEVNRWVEKQNFQEMNVSVVANSSLKEADFLVKSRFFETTFSLSLFEENIVEILESLFGKTNI